MTGYVGDVTSVGTPLSPSPGGGVPILVNTNLEEEQTDFIFMVESLFLLPESFSEELISLALQEENNRRS